MACEAGLVFGQLFWCAFAQHHTDNRNALLQGSGASKVPCLKITETNGQTRWLQDSDAIVAYLRERFATPDA